MNSKYSGAVKAGKLANGLERGKGKVVHIIDSRYVGVWGYSLCGERPAIAWSERELTAATCPKCIRQLRKEITMSNLLGQIDEMVKGGAK